MNNPTLDLAMALISCPSLTPEDAGCQKLLCDRLDKLDFQIERMRFGNVDNFYAKHGSGNPLVVFAGHTDVVPTGPLEAWYTPPFEPTLKNGMLYGRGAADMKTSLAAFITAIEAFLIEYPQHHGTIGVLVTSDEEGVATEGTVKMVEMLKARSEYFDYCIIGEPTSQRVTGDMLKNGRRGSLSGKLIVKGVQGHIAYPHLLKNPIHLVAPALVELNQTIWDDGNSYFPPTSWQISNIHAGTGATNVVPGHIDILFNLRFSTASTAESLQERIHAILDKHQLNYELTWQLSPPYLTPRSKLVEVMSKSIVESYGITPELSTSGGTSDGRFIATICPQVVEFGPCNSTIHQLNECVVMADIEPLKEVYRRTLVALLEQA